MTFAEVESRMDGRFLVIVKGLMVNMDFIRQISSNQCVMRSGATFPLNSKNARKLREKWLNYKCASTRSAVSEREEDV